MSSSHRNSPVPHYVPLEEEVANAERPEIRRFACGGGGVGGLEQPNACRIPLSVLRADEQEEEEEERQARQQPVSSKESDERQATANDSSQHRRRNGQSRRHHCYVGPEEYDRLRADERARQAYYDVLRRALDGRSYEAGAVSRLCSDIADEIKLLAKQLYVERYKIIASVVVGQQGEPSARVASRCLWDSDTDKFHNVVYANGSLFAVATVFGVIVE